MLILSEYEKNDIRKIVCAAIKTSLEEQSEFEKVSDFFKKKYGAYLFDTMDYPEQFKMTLQMVCAKKYFKIVDGIEGQLDEYFELKPIREFVEDLEDSTYATINACD